jgi:RimJ/RimL family protein N-acetyltransferase
VFFTTSGRERAPVTSASSAGPLGVRVVPRTTQHLPAIRDAFASAVISPTTIYHMPRSIAVDFAALAQSKRRRDRPLYSIVAGHHVVGICSLRAPVFAGVELTIAIFDPAYQGAGVGTYAVRSLCDAAFGELRVSRVELGVYPDNVPAIKCYERCGFVCEAVLRRFVYHDGAWRDIYWMARTSAGP